VAGIAPVERLGKNGETRWNAGDVELIAGFFDDGLSAARFGRRLEYAVGSVGYILPGTENADVGFDLVVVGCELFVSDGPVIADAVG
jgi:hypothetical protein